MADKDLVQRVWDMAKPVPGKVDKKSQYRLDPYGNLIERGKYGRNTDHGWVIDHIKPKSEGGSDATRNLQAMQTEKNLELSNTMKKRSRHNQR